MSKTPERAIIVNTSPLVYLYRVGQLDLLSKVYGRILAPASVHEELLKGRQVGADVPDLSVFKWVHIRPLKNSGLLPAVTDLGLGEAEVIGLALEISSSLVVIDDQLGRKIARICGLKVTGTLGVLIKAKQKGHLAAIEPVLRDLEESGFWIGRELIRMVLTKAGERQ